MSVEAMRWLDRWLGVPLCFLLSLGAWWRRRAATRPRRVLCIQLAEMGSIVLAAPAIRWLRDQGIEPYFLTFARNGEALALTGAVPAERVFLLRTGDPLAFAVDTLGALAWAWRHRLDGALDLEPCARFSALLAFLSGARLRSGFRHERAYRGRLHNRPVAYRTDRHMGENLLALAAALLPGQPVPALAVAEAAWRAGLPAAPRGGERVAAALARRLPGLSAGSPLVLLNPNAGDRLPQRRWPAERYVRLARALLARHADLHVGFIGSPDEAPAVAALAAEVGSGRCASLAGDLAVAELPALFVRCRLLVTNDSGPAHLASLTATPTLVLFGPETPILYRPLGDARTLHADLPCSPCIRPANQRASRCADNRCMQAIAVDQVLGAAGALLASPPAYRASSASNSARGSGRLNR